MIRKAIYFSLDRWSEVRCQQSSASPLRPSLPTLESRWDGVPIKAEAGCGLLQFGGFAKAQKNLFAPVLRECVCLLS
jgi:hypothetical protein